MNVSCTLNSYILSWYSLRVKFPLKMKDIGIVEVIGQNSYCSRSGENIIDLWAAKRKQEDSYWSKITRAFLRKEKTKISQLNEKRSSIPWRLRMPIWKIIFCSTLFAIIASYAVNDLPEVHVKWSLILMALLGPVIFSTLWMKGQFLHCERAHLKVSGWSLVSNELLTKKSCPCFCNVWMKLLEVAKRQYQSLNGFGLIETF